MLRNRYQIAGYFIIVILMLFSCETETTLIGDGNVTTTRKAVSSFNRLEINGILNVYLTQGENYRVEVRTDENLQNIVSTESIDQTFKVFTNTSEDFEASEMNVYITAPGVEEILIDGVTALYVKNQINQNNLYIDKRNTGMLYLNAVMQRFTLITDGIGNVELLGKTHDAIIDNAMVGDLHAYNFIANNMVISHKGTGVVEVNVFSSLNAEITGVGDVKCLTEPETYNRTGDGQGRLMIEKKN